MSLPRVKENNESFYQWMISLLLATGVQVWYNQTKSS